MRIQEGNTIEVTVNGQDSISKELEDLVDEICSLLEQDHEEKYGKPKENKTDIPRHW